MSTLTFDRPKEFDLKKYDDDGRFGFGEGEKVRLTFRIERNAGLHLLESPLCSDQQVVELEGEKLEITATVVDSSSEWWLRGFGDAVSHVHRGRQSLAKAHSYAKEIHRFRNYRNRWQLRRTRWLPKPSGEVSSDSSALSPSCRTIPPIKAFWRLCSASWRRIPRSLAKRTPASGARP